MRLGRWRTLIAIEKADTHDSYGKGTRVLTRDIADGGSSMVDGRITAVSEEDGIQWYRSLNLNLGLGLGVASPAHRQYQRSHRMVWKDLYKL